MSAASIPEDCGESAEVVRAPLHPELRLHDQPSEDLTAFNTCRTVLDSVGKEVLEGLLRDFLALPGSSGVVYEKNGDYACGIISAHWCRELDRASRSLCRTEDTRAALRCGLWHCHESCWEASKASMETGQPVDVPCRGGLRIYAVPITASGEIVGSVNFGYGDPPREPRALEEIAGRYGLCVEALRERAAVHRSQPEFVIERAKARLATIATIIGLMIERRVREQSLSTLNERLTQCLSDQTRALEDSEERFRMLSECMPQLVWTATPDGALDHLNRHSLTYTGMTFEELKGWGWQPVVHPDDLPNCLQCWKSSLETGNPYEIEYRLRRSDGAYRWHLGRALPIRNTKGNIIKWVGTCTDIDDYKRAEAALRERAVALLVKQQQLQSLTRELSLAEERERKRLATDLHDNLAQLLAFCKMKLQTVEHDLRSHRSCSTVSEIRAFLDEALAYTRTLMSDLRPRLFGDADDLINALTWVKQKMHRHGLCVTISNDNTIKLLNEELLTIVYQSVQELLWNVLKHARTQHATVTLRRSGDEIEIAVEDQGVGFDVSAAVLGSSHGHFGLFNIRERLDLLGGRLEITSRLGQGTCAKLIVPSKNRAKPTLSSVQPVNGHTGFYGRADQPPEAAASPIRVLLVDDHRLIREGLRSILEGQPDIVVVAEASEGRGALELIAVNRPDVVIMDVNMPGMNGVEATRRIKCKFPHIAVIGLSVYEDEKMAAAMRNAGAEVYLSKGGSFESLCTAIRRKGTRVVHQPG